jgi:hypothetical protein
MDLLIGVSTLQMSLFSRMGAGSLKKRSIIVCNRASISVRRADLVATLHRLSIFLPASQRNGVVDALFLSMSLYGDWNFPGAIKL